MRDGTRLATDLFRPSTAERCPVLLQRTPYGKKGLELMLADALADLVDGGYAIAVQDVRGRFNSEGMWTPFAHEAQDGYDTVHWAANQPWSTGRVGMFGFSYLGLTQLLAASARPPGLMAIAPACTTSDPSANWVYRGGVLDLLLGLHWPLVVVADTARRQGIDNLLLHDMESAMSEVAQALHCSEDGSLQRAAQRLGATMQPVLDCPSLREVEPLRTLAPWFSEWLAHPPPDPYWTRVAPAASYECIDVPALHVSGWYDVFLAGVLHNYVGLRREGRAQQRLIIGPWAHASPELSPPARLGDLDFGPAAHLAFADLQRQWFDSYLQDKRISFMQSPPVKLFVMGDNRWRDEQEWPLPRTRWTRCYLHSQGQANTSHGDGALSFNPGADEPADRFVFDPHDLVPTCGGAVLPVGTLPGPLDQRAVELRSDVLVYSTPTLERRLEVTGPVRAELWASSTAASTDFTAKLVDVHPDGRAIIVCDGILRTRLVPERPTLVVIDLGATSIGLTPGHRLRLEVSSSNYPHFQPNPHAGLTIQRIHHTAERQSFVLLPIVPPL